MKVDSVNESGVFTISKFTVKKVEVEGFMDELKGFHEAFKDCFS